jgi:hypothetical protein
MVNMTNSTALIVYVPKMAVTSIIPEWICVGFIMWILLKIQNIITIGRKRNDLDHSDPDWVFNGLVFDLTNSTELPYEIDIAARKSLYLCTPVYERVYPSGKKAWRIKIKKNYFYLTQTLVLARSKEPEQKGC